MKATAGTVVILLLGACAVLGGVVPSLRRGSSGKPLWRTGPSGPETGFRRKQRVLR